MNVIELAKQYDLLEDSKELKQVIFYRPKELTPFQEFVLTHRLWSFIKLKILFDAKVSGDFIIGYEKVEFTEPDYEYQGEFARTETFGPAVIKQVFSKQQIIDTELKNQDFRVVMHDAPFIDNLDSYDTKGKIIDQVTVDYDKFDLQGNRTEQFFLSTQGNIVLMKDRMYCTEEMYEHFKDMVNYHNKEFETFLKEHGDVGIPHEVYVSWLQKMFPGKISIRSLE